MFSIVSGFFILHHGVQFIMLLGGCLALQAVLAGALGHCI